MLSLNGGYIILYWVICPYIGFRQVHAGRILTPCSRVAYVWTLLDLTFPRLIISSLHKENTWFLLCFCAIFDVRQAQKILSILPNSTNCAKRTSRIKKNNPKRTQSGNSAMHPDCHNIGPANTEHSFDLGWAPAWTWQTYTKNIISWWFVHFLFFVCVVFLWTTWTITILVWKDLERTWSSGNVRLFGYIEPNWACLGAMLGPASGPFGPIGPVLW